MIANDGELQTTQDRIAWFQKQALQLRKTETNPLNYRAAVSGFLIEIDRMQLDVREYLYSLPSEQAVTGQRDTEDGGRIGDVPVPTEPVRAV